MSNPLANFGMTLTDYVDELTQPHQHREPYQYELGRTTYTLHHQTRVPSLLEQLQFASPTGQGEERSGGGYESRPAASIDSIDTLAQIDLEAARWVTDLGEKDRNTTGDCIRQLNGLAASLDRCKTPGKERKRDCCAFHMLERDVRHWWARARVMTGWDSPAWRPDNTCPMCDERGSLRIKLVDQIGFCTKCHDTWDHATISHLADHIRAESAGARRVPATVYCWCEWPRPAVDAWPAHCTACASPWCHRAGWIKALEGPTPGPQHAFADDIDGRMGA